MREDLIKKEPGAILLDLSTTLAANLTGWNTRILSQAGNGAHQINLVGIPLFTMEGIEIPNNIAKRV